MNFFKSYENAEWRIAIWRNSRKLRRKSDVRRENETLSVYCSWEKALFEVFDVLFQNRQGSLVSKNNKKQSLVMQSDKRQKIVKKMWCSKKMLFFLVFVASEWRPFLSVVHLFLKFSNTIRRNQQSWGENLMFQEKKLFDTFCSWEKIFLWFFDFFKQNHQCSLVSKKTAKNKL